MQELSPNEEIVVNLLSLDKMVDSPGPVFGLSQSSSSAPHSPINAPEHDQEAGGSSYEMMTEDIENVTNASHIEEVGHSSNNSAGRKTRKRTAAANHEEAEWKHDLLVEQTKYLKQMVDNSNDCARYARKTFHLKESQATKKDAYMLRKEKFREAQLNYKMQLLQYKKAKLELLEHEQTKT